MSVIGILQRFPREIRQAIFSYAMDLAKPITVQQCCGPLSTLLDRVQCPKHGFESGSFDFPLPMSEQLRDALGDFSELIPLVVHNHRRSRFALLSTCTTINEEARYVLYTRGQLLIELTIAFGDYLPNILDWTKDHADIYSGYKELFDARVDSLPPGVQRFWHVAARFSMVQILLPDKNHEPHLVYITDNPVFYMFGLFETAFAVAHLRWYSKVADFLKDSEGRIIVPRIHIDLAGIVSWSNEFYTNGWTYDSLNELTSLDVDSFKKVGERVHKELADYVRDTSSMADWLITIDAGNVYGPEDVRLWRQVTKDYMAVNVGFFWRGEPRELDEDTDEDIGPLLLNL